MTNTYICETAKYKPELWACNPEDDVKRTNNAAEGFHSHYNAEFYSDHPDFFTFLDVLKNNQAVTYVKIRAMDEVQKKKFDDQLAMVQEAYVKYQSSGITRSNFLKIAGYRFSPDELTSHPVEDKIQ